MGYEGSVRGEHSTESPLPTYQSPVHKALFSVKRISRIEAGGSTVGRALALHMAGLDLIPSTLDGHLSQEWV